MKKLFFVFLGMVLLLVTAAVAIPFFVDVDQYRPKIVEIANRQINGRLELGKLTLSLWGRILVKVDGVKVSDASGKEVVSVQDAYFHLPFASILGGTPELTFRMTEPAITVIRSAEGEINLLKLAKKSDSATPGANQAQPQPGAAPADKGAAAVALPAIATRARLGVELRDARVLFRDIGSDLTNQLNRLNLILTDISLSSPMGIEFWADLDTRLGRTVSVKGPARMTGTVEPRFNGAEFARVSATLKTTLDDLAISIPGLFEKKAGIPLSLQAELAATPEEARIGKALLKFHNVELTMTGSVSNLSGGAHGQPAPPLVKVMLKSNAVALEPWAELVPLMKPYGVSGTVQFQASASGPSTALKYDALVNLAQVGATVPMMRGKPSVSGDIHVINDEVRSLLKASAPGGDLSIDTKVTSFSKPHIRFAVTSQGMDLDKMLVLPQPGAAKAAAQGTSGPGETAPAGTAGASATEEDYDLLLKPLRENPMAHQVTANGTISIPRMIVYGIQMSDIRAKFQLAKLVATLDGFGLKVLDGTIAASSVMDLSREIPRYRMETTVAGLDLQKAVSSQLQLFKDTLYGKASASMKGEGASFTPSKAKKNLSLKGNLKVEDATFASIDASKMVVGGVNDAVDRIADKHPMLKGLKGKKLERNVDTESRYSLISSDFSLSQGVFDAPNFVAKAAPKKGIDLEGKTRVNILSYALDARWLVIDRYDMTGASKIDMPAVEGTVIPRALLMPGQPFQVPVSVRGTLNSPEYSYTEVPEYLGKVVLANAQNAAKGALKAKAVEQIQKKVLQKAPVPKGVQEKAGKKIKKLFGF